VGRPAQPVVPHQALVKVMETMNKIELKAALDEIGLALNACNNCVTTDLPEIEPNETSWRIDNSKALRLVDDIARDLGISIDSDL